MKIHFEEILDAGIEALAIWQKENLIPYKIKKCTGLMMSKSCEAFFTDNIEKVTCKLCLKILEKENKKC